MKKIILKEHKDLPIKNRHPWIFSGAILSMPQDLSTGEILPVYSSSNILLGHGYFNPLCSLIGRMVSFDNTPPLQAIELSIQKALSLRASLPSLKHTNAYRLINGESDSLPGLIVDLYDHILVVQISTLGMEKLKIFLIETLKKHLPRCTAIYEKSTLPSRKEEGLENFEGTLFGTLPEEVLIKENNLTYSISITDSQKTGFFLDQREMRLLIKEFSFEKSVLNCFCYTGAFSLSALQGKASKVTSIDSSLPALQQAKKNFELNGFDPKNHEFIQQDVFTFFENLNKKSSNQKTAPESLPYDLIILDPPAFAKKKKDLSNAYLGYLRLNKLCLEKMKKNSFLLTCSCSYYMDQKLFEKMLFEASIEAKKDVKILSRHRLAQDHPISVFHPESDYLKSTLLYVN